MRQKKIGAPRLEEIRKICGKWDEVEGCKEDYPEECEVFTLCARNAMGNIDDEQHGGGNY